MFFMGKTGRKNKVYSAEFKIGVIMDMTLISTKNLQSKAAKE